MASNITARKKIAAATKAKVCQWLKWSELEYAEFQYECGLTYLRHYITHDPWGQDMLQRSAIFWNWWKNHWTQRDVSFTDVETEENMCHLSAQLLRQMYFDVHNPVTLASDIYPSRVVLDESYNQMIASLIKEEVHA